MLYKSINFVINFLSLCYTTTDMLKCSESELLGELEICVIQSSSLSKIFQTRLPHEKILVLVIFGHIVFDF